MCNRIKAVRNRVYLKAAADDNDPVDSIFSDNLYSLIILFLKRIDDLSACV